jgi:glutathione S-transferase
VTHLGTLYTFRRCPYAIRARMTLAASGVDLEVREILLAAKPTAFLELSSKGTVPVLDLTDGPLLDESRDIMVWALQRKDPHNWLRGNSGATQELLDRNDGPFKTHLDRYKYAAGDADIDPLAERDAAASFLHPLEQQLRGSAFLQGEHPSLADVGIFPFVRQYAGVDPVWFAQELPELQRWREHWQGQPLFTRIMRKLDAWESGARPVLFQSVFGAGD